MPAEVQKEIQLEIAHVLFIDIVGYSKLLINEQRSLLDTRSEVEDKVSRLRVKLRRAKENREQRSIGALRFSRQFDSFDALFARADKGKKNGDLAGTG